MGNNSVVLSKFKKKSAITQSLHTEKTFTKANDLRFFFISTV